MSWWVKAARLRTLPLAIATVLIGAAGMEWNQRNLVVFVLSLLTAISLQVFSNFANDFGDFENGADNESRIGPSRVMQSGEVSKVIMKKALVLLGLVSFFLGLSLLIFALLPSGKIVEFFLFLAVGILAIWSAFKYTAGENPYGYKGLGDVFVFFFFGIVSPAGVFFLTRLDIHFDLLFRILLVGGASVMVLHLNNMRDQESDVKAKKYTIATRLGFENSKQLHYIYMICVFSSVVFLFFNLPQSINSYLFLGFTASWMLIHFITIWGVKQPSAFDGQLKVVALGTFATSLFYTCC
ncbi:MAG: 1,4-dihydroxy-2-naphthoate octaprenyltransferase [Bacteroidota bacterium]